jgi:hypothetical protein
MRTSKLYQKIYVICIEYIPDGHANITFLFLETTLVPQFSK